MSIWMKVVSCSTHDVLKMLGCCCWTYVWLGVEGLAHQTEELDFTGSEADGVGGFVGHCVGGGGVVVRVGVGGCCCLGYKWCGVDRARDLWEN